MCTEKYQMCAKNTSVRSKNHQSCLLFKAKKRAFVLFFLLFFSFFYFCHHYKGVYYRARIRNRTLGQYSKVRARKRVRRFVRAKQNLIKKSKVRSERLTHSKVCSAGAKNGEYKSSSNVHFSCQKLEYSRVIANI